MSEKYTLVTGNASTCITLGLQCGNLGVLQSLQETLVPSVFACNTHDTRMDTLRNCIEGHFLLPYRHDMVMSCSNNGSRNAMWAIARQARADLEDSHNQLLAIIKVLLDLVSQVFSVSCALGQTEVIFGVATLVHQ